MTENYDYDVIVIGAGAAGMVAAGRAGKMGARVLLLEKMERPGKKILISGNGRCNLTNSAELEDFISRFGANGRFLYSAFSRFFRDDIIALLKRYRVECRTGPTGKVYPVSDNARDVVLALMRYMTEMTVDIRYGVGLSGLKIENGKLSGIETTEGFIPVQKLILAAGGASHPQTGSDGSGYKIAGEAGHNIIRLRPGLVPMVVKDIEAARRMQGASLRDARVTAFQCAAKDIDVSLTPNKDTGERLPGKRPKLPIIESRTGDVIITHFGFSGPVMLEMSLAMVDALENGPVSVSIDLFPEKDKAALRAELQRTFDKFSSQIIQNAVRHLIPKKIVEPLIAAVGISQVKLCNQVNAEERDRLADQMKSVRFDIERPYSMATAMVTAGGVSLNEVDPRTMESKLVKGLYFCGEILDLDAGTGGFNLQAAFSTGYIAGESAATATK